MPFCCGVLRFRLFHQLLQKLRQLVHNGVVSRADVAHDAVVEVRVQKRAVKAEEGRIEFDAVAKDEGDRRTIIDGYVSPRNSYIDLGIKAEGTRAEFLSGFCDSFMDNINANINGKLNVVGAFKNINLIGKAKVDGSVRLTALNTTYALRGDSVYFLPDEIRFCNDTIYDRHNNIGIMTGGLHHHNFSNWTYDINVEAQNLLSYDTHSFDGESFYGTAYTTGTLRPVRHLQMWGARGTWCE